MIAARFLKFVGKDYFPKGGRVLDIGCYNGRESKELLERGFEVDAIDYKTIPQIVDPKFHFQKIALEEYVIAPENYNLILAYYILPFLKQKELISKAVRDIRKGLKKDGIAIITLFGNEHEWKDRGHHFFSTLEVAKEMIGDYVDMTEEKGPTKTMGGEMVFWHSWDFIIKK